MNGDIFSLKMCYLNSLTLTERWVTLSPCFQITTLELRDIGLSTPDDVPSVGRMWDLNLHPHGWSEQQEEPPM